MFHTPFTEMEILNWIHIILAPFSIVFNPIQLWWITGGEWSNFNANKASFSSKCKHMWTQTTCNLVNVCMSETGVWVRIKSLGWAYCRKNDNLVQSPDGDSDLSRIQLFAGQEHLNIGKSTDVNFLCMFKEKRFGVSYPVWMHTKSLFWLFAFDSALAAPFSSDDTVKTCENSHGTEFLSWKLICHSSLPQCL